MIDALRLCVGTLTVLPVRPPAAVDRRTAATAMALAPLGGVLLAVPLVALALLDAAPLLLAALVVGGLALLTRGLHLDGLADTADGLGSGRTGADGLAVMRRSDIGPFGVVTLLLVLLVQVAALSRLLELGVGAATLAAALVVSRGVLPVLCTGWFPAARSDGLGRAVAASVPRSAAAASLLATVAVGCLGAAGLTHLIFDQPLCGGVPADYGWFAYTPLGGGRTELADGGPFDFLTDPSSGSWPAPLVGTVVLAAAVLAVAVAVLLARRCVRRFGGVTGDVYGACVELAFTTLLVVPALVLL